MKTTVIYATRPKKEQNARLKKVRLPWIKYNPLIFRLGIFLPNLHKFAFLYLSNTSKITHSPPFSNLPFFPNTSFNGHPKNLPFLTILPYYNLCKFPKLTFLPTFPNFLLSPILSILRTTSLYKKKKTKKPIQSIQTLKTIFLQEYFITVVK